MYNPGMDFSQGSGLALTRSNRGFSALEVKIRAYSELYCHCFQAGISRGAIAGTSVAVLLMAICSYFGLSTRKKVNRLSLLCTDSPTPPGLGMVRSTPLGKHTESIGHVGGASPGLSGISMDKSVEFSYEELAKATNNFSSSKKIGQGGFGTVYYGMLRGEKAAIKKMDTQASKEFLAELNVLTHVHHLNLVHLIGCCVEGSLFLVYEYIENGNLSEHLHGSGWESLPWTTRVQIALHSARGLEYIHEHTVPVYIHRDIKSANILIDRNFHGKVADFGLTKLTEVGNSSLQTRLVGTFGYMPPDPLMVCICLLVGMLSMVIYPLRLMYMLLELCLNLYKRRKLWLKQMDVLLNQGDLLIWLAFLPCRAQLMNNVTTGSDKNLTFLSLNNIQFEDVLSQIDPKDDLANLVDPKLGKDYPLDSVLKMAQLAKACTQENPQLRPSMRSIVVALTTLSSSSDDWDVGSFYENQALVNLVTGR
ncbi:hypothetical protein C5167_009434 [Papaver somniferum]|uniref:Protein kinase domain-containing protein n=1 Tax=Papaver somniferum TaxID=3469 RepID=A0A4Y7K1A6_PAPSO|nr:hypothetical protein C5167_009434 [Papaver somniferum]